MILEDRFNRCQRFLIEKVKTISGWDAVLKIMKLKIVVSIQLKV